MRQEPDIIISLADIRRQLEELKTRQFIGSNQIVLNTFMLSGTYDWGGQLTATTGYDLQKARGLLVTVTAQKQDNLIADLIVEISKSSSMSPLWTKKDDLNASFAGTGTLSLSYWPIPLSTTDSKMKKWQIFLLGDTNIYAYVKFQAVANDDVTITVVQNL